LQMHFRKVTTPRCLYRCCEHWRQAFEPSRRTANSSLIGKGISRSNSIIRWQGYRVSPSRLAESNFRYTQGVMLSSCTMRYELTFAWEGRAIRACNRAVRRDCRAPDPWRVTPPIRPNLVFGSDSHLGGNPWQRLHRHPSLVRAWFIPARAGGTLYRTYFAKKMLTYLEASRQQRYIHERWPVSKRVNSSRASGDDSTLIERSRDDR
jgi:hypothetical protein